MATKKQDDGQEPKLELTLEMTARGCRLCTDEEMKQMPALFQNLGICDKDGNLLVSLDPEIGSNGWH